MENKIPISFNEAFIIFQFHGNATDMNTAFNKMTKELPGLLDRLVSMGKPMKPVGAPAIIKDDNFWKIILLLWEDREHDMFQKPALKQRNAIAGGMECNFIESKLPGSEEKKW